MPMHMMRIGYVRMGMPHRRVAMGMTVLSLWHWIVHMIVVPVVVRVRVFMREFFMPVFVTV